MATLHLLCGLPGSGKTTLAKELEKQYAALRLTSDEWMERIVGDGFNDEKKDVIEQIQAEVARRVLELGIDVILDFGVWSRKERDALRAEAKEVGAKTKLYFLDVPI
jgi:predicted kinase